MLQQFGDKLKTTLCDFNGEKEFSGVTLVCGDHQVEAHKVFMAAGSSLFKKILNFSTYPSVPDMFQVRKIEMLLAKEEGKDAAFLERSS